MMSKFTNEDPTFREPHCRATQHRKDVNAQLKTSSTSQSCHTQSNPSGAEGVWTKNALNIIAYTPHDEVLLPRLP